jgi:hypothetical protein
LRTAIGPAPGRSVYRTTRPMTVILAHRMPDATKRHVHTAERYSARKSLSEAYVSPGRAG